MSDKPAEQPPNPLDALLAEQRRGARSVETGHFRLDWTKALDKVKRFQLTDPHRYVLEVVQGAIAGKATLIEVTTDADDVIVTWDATPVGAGDLEQLFDYLFAQDEALTAQKQLALAVNSALALGPKFVRLDVGDGDGGHRLELSTHTDLRVGPLSGDEKVTGARLQVRDRVSWQVFADLFRSESVEARLVSSLCRYAPVPVVVNRRDVTSGLGPHRYLIDFSGGDTHGQVALPATPNRSSVLSVCMNGVEVVEHRFEDEPELAALGFVAWVEAPGLTRNASHSDIHRDTSYARMIKRVRAAVRELQELVAAGLLLDDTGAPRPPDSLSEQELADATLLARLLLHFRKGALPPALDAMLDLPGIVSIATEDAPDRMLRAVWEQFAKHGKLAVATRRYNVRVRDLPGGRLPVLGPRWVIEKTFGNATEVMDETLDEIERGQKLRRLREARRREPNLSATEALIDVPIEDSTRGIRGELGVTTDVVPPVAALVNPSGCGDLPHKQGGANTLIIYLKDGVPLGGEWIQTALLGGVALLDSDAFEPEPSWASFHSNKATRAARGLVDAAVPRVAEAMAKSFSALPPVQSLCDAGAWTPLPEDNSRLMREISASWPTDEMAKNAREHIDVLLSRRKIPREEAPALWAWPLFYTLDGRAVSLDQISGNVPVDGAVVADWRVVIEEPWGDGASEGSLLLNLTDTEREALTRQLGRAPREGGSVLTARRLHLAEEAEAAQARVHNMSLAEQRRQKPELAHLTHEAVVDLDLPGGRGQAGLPSLGDDSCWIRYLFDGLPLPDDAIDSPFPVHVVVEHPGLEPDAAFEKVKPSPIIGTVLDAVVAARPALMAAFAGRAVAYSRRGTELLWGWLADHPTPKKKPLSAIPDGVLDAPIVPTVSGEKLTLRALAADVNTFGHVRYVEISPGRQDSDRPIVVCGEDRRKLLCRLLGTTAHDYDRELKRELAALDRRTQPRRSPRLSEATAISRTFEDNGLDGEIGLASGHLDGWVNVLIDGIPLERRALELGGAPFIAAISGGELKANSNFTHVRKNAAWKEAEKLLAREADQLVIDACEATLKGSLSAGGAALLASLRAIAADRFEGRPERALEPKDEVDKALAAALIWESVDPRDFVSLGEVAEHWRRADVVWVVDEGEGQLAVGRVIVRTDVGGAIELRKIFGKRVRDGHEVFERDQEAIRRRASAPPIHTRLTNTFGPIDVDAESEELGLRARGQVGVPTLYRTAAEGLTVALGVDGRQLTELTVDAPMRAVAAIDTTGLEVNAAWTKPSNQRQVNWLHQQLEAAAWTAAEHAARGTDALSGPDAEARRRLLVDLLAAAGDDRADLRARLEAMPLFRTVQRQSVSLKQLRQRIAAGETIFAVDDSLDEGVPRDGRTIVRGDVATLIALTNSLKGAVTRDDNRWREEIVGTARFQSLISEAPELRGDCAEQLYFDDGPTRGLIGLLRPAADATLDDSGDPPSQLRLHIGGRNVVDHAPALHPAVEVWVDDDRLQPTLDFRDVERNDVYDQVVATVSQQLPELVARAAQHWAGDPTGRVRLRLATYALGRHQALAKAADAEPGGPEARLLDAPLWSCLTGAGAERMSTRHILAAHADGKLRTARDDAPPERTEPGIACILGDSDREIATQYLGEVKDYTGDLERLAARRAFLGRPQVHAIEVAQVTRDPLLIVRRLDAAGWEGEVALTAHVGRGTELHLFVERRSFATFELPGPCRAVVAVEHQGLQSTPRYDDVVRDAAWDALVARIGEAVQDALVELAAGPIEAPQARVLLDALSAARATRANADDGSTRVIDALEKAPLLRDVGGDRWSIAALRDKFPNGAQMPYVGPETAAAGNAAGDRVTLVIDEATWAAANRLLPLARDDQRYLESAAGQRRREQAPTRYGLPRGAVAEAEISSSLFNGTLALSAPPEAGRIGVMSRGRLVEERELPDLFGLCGFIDGAIETDRGFEHVTLREAHETELTRLWNQRLEAAAAQAADWHGRRSARWRALAGYAQRFVLARLDDLGPSQRARRDAMSAPPQGLPAAVARAVAAPIIETNDGEWVSVATAIAGDDPVVIVADKELERPPQSDARVLLGDAVTLRLLSALLGSSSVMSVEQARAAVDAKREEAAKKRQAAEEARARRAASAENRTLSALRSILRAATTNAFPLRVARDVSTTPVGERRPLCQRDGDAITINKLHPLWKQAVAAKTDDVAGVVPHLAIAVIAAVTAPKPGGLINADEAIEVLTILGEKRS